VFLSHRSAGEAAVSGSVRRRAEGRGRSTRPSRLPWCSSRRRGRRCLEEGSATCASPASTAGPKVDDAALATPRRTSPSSWRPISSEPSHTPPSPPTEAEVAEGEMVALALPPLRRRAEQPLPGVDVAVGDRGDDTDIAQVGEQRQKRRLGGGELRGPIPLPAGRLRGASPCSVTPQLSDEMSRKGVRRSSGGSAPSCRSV
jgi:hypothetical protein